MVQYPSARPCCWRQPSTPGIPSSSLRHTGARRGASNTPTPLWTQEDQEDFFISKYSSRLKVLTDYSMVIRGCEKRQSLFGSISISHYFISVYLAEKGLQYLPTNKPTLHPEENCIMIILKITSKSYLTFKVKYCIIRRQCSKVSNSAILQTTAKLQTSIKANTAITVHTTFLGWLKDLALCLLCCIQFLVSSRVGVQQHSAQAYVCSHCTALSSCCLHLQELFQVLFFMQNHTGLHIPPGKKISFNSRTLSATTKNNPSLNCFAHVFFLSASEVLQWCLIIKLGVKVVAVQFLSTCSAFLYEWTLSSFNFRLFLFEKDEGGIRPWGCSRKIRNSYLLCRLNSVWTELRSENYFSVCKQIKKRSLFCKTQLAIKFKQRIFKWDRWLSLWWHFYFKTRNFSFLNE